MSNPYQVVKQFERALCDYTGAPYAVAVNSCTMALLLAVAWHMSRDPEVQAFFGEYRPAIEIPKRTYVSVPMSIIHAGGRPTFRDEEWLGCYQLKPLPVWDSARYFTAGLYYGTVELEQVFFDRSDGNTLQSVTTKRDCAGQMICVSFHWSKPLGIGQGGAILHDNTEADAWLRRARFDGRTEAIEPKDDTFGVLGWHCYMTPRDAAEGLSRLALLPHRVAPLPNDDYPDLSQMEIFK